MTTLAHNLKYDYAGRVRELGGKRYYFQHQPDSPIMYMRELTWDAPDKPPFHAKHYEAGDYQVNLADGAVTTRQNGLRFGTLTPEGLTTTPPRKAKDVSGKKPDLMSDPLPTAPSYLNQYANANEVKKIDGQGVFQFSNLDKNRISMREMPSGTDQYNKRSAPGKVRIINKKTGVTYSAAGTKVGRFVGKGFAPNSDNNPSLKGKVCPIKDVDPGKYRDDDEPPVVNIAEPSPWDKMAGQLRADKVYADERAARGQEPLPFEDVRPGAQQMNEHLGPPRLEDSIDKLVKFNDQVYRVRKYRHDPQKLLLAEFDDNPEITTPRNRIGQTFLYDLRSCTLYDCTGRPAGKFSGSTYYPANQQIGRPEHYQIERYEQGSQRPKDKRGDVLYSQV